MQVKYNGRSPSKVTIKKEIKKIKTGESFEMTEEEYKTISGLSEFQVIGSEDKRKIKAVCPICKGTNVHFKKGCLDCKNKD